MKKSQSFDNYTLQNAAQCFSVICHPQRVRIITLLEEYDELNVTQIYERLNLIQAETSHHLLLLRINRILNTVRSGKFRIYSVNKPFLEKIKEYAEVLNQTGHVTKDVKTNKPSKKKEKRMSREEFKVRYPKAYNYLTEILEKGRKR